jgi:UDP-N-acetylglucosamine:LPS N-acetylglucosamine transferase
MVITAGGNTLMEAAASGTPALVTWEDPHERDQGEVFERLGAAIVLGKGELLDPSLLRQQTEKLLDSPETLSAMMIAGRRAVDGRGAVRIADVILEKIRQ